MIEIKEGVHTNHIHPNDERRPNLDSRWGEERRKQPSNGYAYISSIGWIDRRDRFRRKDDPNNF